MVGLGFMVQDFKHAHSELFENQGTEDYRIGIVSQLILRVLHRIVLASVVLKGVRAPSLAMLFHCP